MPPCHGRLMGRDPHSCKFLMRLQRTSLYGREGRQQAHSQGKRTSCPLAQSAERIHGKENSGAILLVR